MALTGAEKQAHPVMCGVYLGNTWRVYLPFSTCKTQWQRWGYPREYVKAQHSFSWCFSSRTPPTVFVIMSLFPCIPKLCIKTFLCLKVWLCSGLAGYSVPCGLNLQYSFDFRQINSYLNYKCGCYIPQTEAMSTWSFHVPGSTILLDR